MNFTHLHNHDQYSYLDGLGRPEKWVKRAKKMGFSHLAITNHGNIDGCIKFQKACIKEDIRPIIGCELYVVEDIRIKGIKDNENKTIKEKRSHLTVLVKNNTGWKNLLEMLTIANIEGFYYRPRVDAETILKHSEGLVFMTACCASFLVADYGMDLLESLVQKHPNDVHLEIMPNPGEEQTKLNKIIRTVKKKYNLGLVATNDCHYPCEGDNVAQEVLLAIQTKAKWTDEKRWKFPISDLYLKSEDKMYEDFQSIGYFTDREIYSAIRNTGLIAKKCEDFFIEKIDIELPKVPRYEDIDETELLTKLSRKGFRSKIDPITKEYRERLKEELELICFKGYQRYFLIVWELINWCKANNILVGPGRGSASGSLVAYLLGLTKVDPIKYKLLFARFISRSRNDLPDIDIDFEDRKRHLVREHLEELYGFDNIAGISTFMVMKGRGSLRDTARVFNVPYSDVDKASKSIVVKENGDLREDFCIEDSFNAFEDGIKFKEKYPDVTKLAIQLEGQVKGLGQHASAICISKENLKNGKRGNLCNRKNTIVINFDKYDSEYMGMMKLDVLGLKALSVLSGTLEIIKDRYGIEIDLEKMELDDKETYEEVSKGHCVAAFQIGTPGLSQYCKELKVDNFKELVDAISLWRPGTLRSGATSDFKDRKFGKESWDSLHPILDDITKDTYGIILYQEQVMLLMYRLAGLDWEVCDTVRKVISKSQGGELFRSFEQQFVNGCKKEDTLTEEEARKFWEELASFGAYSFNLSHAVGYGMITYWEMYLKVHYPTEYMACSLSYGVRKEDKDRKYAFINEARRMGLKIKLPKLGFSKAAEWLTDENKNLFIPFLEIKGVGDKTALAISSMGDIDKKTKGVSKTIVEKLKHIGADNIKKVYTDQEEEDLGKYFDFDISTNKLGDLKGLYELIEKKITLFKNVNLSKVSERKRYYLGRIKDLRLKHGKNRDSAGSAFGYFESIDGISAMVAFSPELYQENKVKIEHCEDKWLIIEAKSPNQNSILVVDKLVTEDDIREGNVENFNLGLLNKVKKKRLEGLRDCDKCKLSKGKTVSSLPILNLAIVKETASFSSYGYRDDKLLIDELKKYKLSEDLFLNTYVVKCCIDKKKVTKKIATTCGTTWLKEELKQNGIVAVLAFGNLGLSYFKEVDTGITKMSGTIEWNRKHKMWVCYCITPAAANYEESNMELFKETIKKFSNFINKGLNYERRK